jgi:hypothetical protein
MKYLLLIVSIICSIFSVDSQAYQTEMPTVCQVQYYCHDCCKGIAPWLAKPEQQNFAPETMKQVNPTEQGK